ncbi:response regulator transcription factor [Chloroflexota bacterium]
MIPYFWQRLNRWFSGQRTLVVKVRPGNLISQIRCHWQSLSPRQQEIAILICQGYTNQQIADALHISTATVKTHIRRILAKFKLHSKAELRFLLSVQEDENPPSIF